jgi:hypothetical protein
MSNPDGCTEQNATINMMPFNLDFAGFVPVNKYMKFHTVSHGDEEGTNISHFRGRSIKGISVCLPVGVSGMIISQAKRAEASRVTCAFSELVLWEHDIPPNTTVLKEVFDWMDIASAVSLRILLLCLINVVYLDQVNNV